MSVPGLQVCPAAVRPLRRCHDLSVSPGAVAVDAAGIESDVPSSGCFEVLYDSAVQVR